MDVTRRRPGLLKQVQELAEINAVLLAEKARLERSYEELETANSLLEQKIKSLQVAIAILIAGSGGLGVGLATSLTGAAVQTALVSATGVFFAMIMASIAILTFMRR